MKPDIHLVENSSCIDVLSSSYDNKIAVATDKYVYVMEQTYNPSFRFDFLNLSKEIVKDSKEDHQFYDVGVDTALIKKLHKASYVQQRSKLNGLLLERDTVSPHAERFLTVKFSPVCDDKERFQSEIFEKGIDKDNVVEMYGLPLLPGGCHFLEDMTYQTDLYMFQWETFLSILATLSRDHRVVVYCTGKGQTFAKVANLSDKLYEFAKKTDFTLSYGGEEAQTTNERSTDVDECQRRLDAVSVSGMEWSGIFTSSAVQAPPRRGKHKANGKCPKPDPTPTTVLLATALKSNHVVLWKFACPVNQKSRPELATVIHIDDPPRVMHWSGHVGEHKEKAYLAIGGYEGRISIWGVSADEDVMVERELDVWTEKDEIPVQALTWVHSLCTGKCLVLLAAKGPCVLVFQIRLVKGSMEILHQSRSYTMHTALVSGVCNIGDKVYTSSIDGSIQVAQVKQDDDISVDLSLLEQPKYMTTRINGMAASTNGIYLTTVNRHSHYAKLVEKSNLSFIQIALDQETEQMLMEPKGKLCNKFDCLDWLYQKLSPEGAIPNTIVPILSDAVLADKTPNETFYLLKLRRLVMMMVVHRISREIYHSRGRKRDNLDEMIKTKEDHVKEISDRIVKLHIEKSLEELASADEKKKDTGRAKRVQKLMSDWLMLDDSQSKEPIKSTDSVAVDGGACESCRLCGENISITSREDGSCQNGHRWKRCSQSLMLCQTLKPNSCAYCRTCYASREETDSPWLHNLLSSHCLWCDGPLTDR